MRTPWIRRGQTEFEYFSELVGSKSNQETVTKQCYYTLNDQKCAENCAGRSWSSCKSKMNRNEIVHGEYLTRSKTNLIDKGGFGRVYTGKWHGQEAAFKFIRADKLIPVGESTDKLFQEDMRGKSQ